MGRARSERASTATKPEEDTVPQPLLPDLPESRRARAGRASARFRGQQGLGVGGARRREGMGRLKPVPVRLLDKTKQARKIVADAVGAVLLRVRRVFGAGNQKTRKQRRGPCAAPIKDATTKLPCKAYRQERSGGGRRDGMSGKTLSLTSSKKARRGHRTAVFVLGISIPAVATAHEIDQYTVPVGREFADLRLYFAAEFHDALADAVDRTNTRIRRSLRHGQATSRTRRLQSPDTMAWAVVTEFPAVIYHVEVLELALRSRKVRERYPGLVTAYQPLVSVYNHWALMLDPTKIVRMRRCSTIMIDGSYVGLDKVVHFVHMGFIYYSTYRKAKARGLDDPEAMRHVVTFGTGFHPLSETSLLGLLSTGVRSNGDLAANYAGLKFYRNLTEEVRVRGEMQPPLLVRAGEYWRLNDHVRPNSDFFTIFVTDHWDEVLNPNFYASGVAFWVRGEVQKRCDDLLGWYLDAQGRPRNKDQFARIAKELTTYFGEDYGHGGDLSKLVSVPNCCFDEAQPPGQGQPQQSTGLAAATVTIENDERQAVRTADSREIDVPGSDVNARDAFGRTPLWWAANGGRTKDVQELIANGADVNAIDIDREGPLHCAARWGRKSIVECLIEHGAVVDAKAAYGLTPLHLAARGLRSEVASTLLNHGANANARDMFGCTPLHDSAVRGDLRTVEALVAASANPNARNSQGTTPLHHAARAGHAEIVRLLMSAGADGSVTNAIGRTPRDEALLGRYDLVLEYLKPVEPGSDAQESAVSRRAAGPQNSKTRRVQE